jgi:hypothetical protein
MPAFDADFLSVEPPKIGIVSKHAHQLRPHFFQGITLPTKAAEQAARCSGNEKSHRPHAGSFRCPPPARSLVHFF